MHHGTLFGAQAWSVGRQTTLVLTAILGGIYLGASTVSEIDPFYRNGVAKQGSSYTSNGWRGADAVTAPSIPLADPLSQFVSAYAYSDAAPDREASIGNAYVEQPLLDEPVDVPADPEQAGAFYQCIGCDEVPTAAAPAAPPDCRAGDWTCSDDSRPPSEEERAAISVQRDGDFLPN